MQTYLKVLVVLLKLCRYRFFIIYNPFNNFYMTSYLCIKLAYVLPPFPYFKKLYKWKGQKVHFDLKKFFIVIVD